VTASDLGSVPGNAGRNAYTAPSRHHFADRRERSDESDDRLHGSIVELQAFLGDKRRAWSKACEVWEADPTTINWDEVMRCAGDIKRIKAAISDLTGKPTRMPPRLPWEKAI
jgi:hypothetical protein